MGDFNLDFSQKFKIDFSHKHLFEDLELELGELNLQQIITSPTCSHTCLGIVKSSTLHHVYTTDSTDISNISYRESIFGDHRLIFFNLKITGKNLNFNY